MSERGRPVVLEEEMTEPGAAVTAYRRSEEPPGVAGDHRDRDRYEHKDRTREMEAPARAIPVLGKVERIELGKGCVTSPHSRFLATVARAERAAKPGGTQGCAARRSLGRARVTPRYASGLSCGNRITSRIDGLSVNSITRRSMPMPSPAAGGMPCSSARM